MTSGLTPLSQRLLRVTAVLSALLIAVVVYGWRSGQEDANPLSPVFNPIARAATETAHLPGMRMTMSGTAALTGGSAGMALSSDTVFNGRTQRARGRVTVTTMGQSEQVQMVAAEGRVWVRSDEWAGRLPGGAEWLGVEAAGGDTGQQSGGGATFSGAGDPHQQLQVLRSVSGNVVELGQAMIGGVRTTAYRGDVDIDDLVSKLRDEGDDAMADSYDRMADEMPQMEVTVWIDAKGLLRQTEALLPIPAADDHPSGFIDVTAAYSDFGIRPKIALPDPSRVFEAPPLPPSGTAS